MKWREKTETKPYHGDSRTITKFAFLPIHCKNGTCAWLEKVKIMQEYRIDPIGHWINKAFI